MRKINMLHYVKGNNLVKFTETYGSSGHNTWTWREGIYDNGWMRFYSRSSAEPFSALWRGVTLYNWTKDMEGLLND